MTEQPWIERASYLVSQLWQLWAQRDISWFFFKQSLEVLQAKAME